MIYIFKQVFFVRAAVFMLFGGFLFVLPFAAWNGAAAQSGWKAEWKKTLAAANKEGIVVVYAQSSQRFRSYVQKQWAKDFPKIDISLTTMRGGQFIRRIKTERKAGKYLWDVAVTGSSSGYVLSKVGILDPVLPEFIFPDVKDPKTWGGWKAAFFDDDMKYIFATQGFLKTPYYNAKIIPPAKAKRLGLKLLFDPAYKGKIIWQDPLAIGGGMTFSLVLRRWMGDEGLKKFILDQKVVFAVKTHQVVERMVRGSMAIAIGPIVTSEIQPYIDAGIKLDIRPFGNSPNVAYKNVAGSFLNVYNRRPHPNATRVFVNWLLSKDIQYGISKVMLQDSRRVDVPSVAEPARTPIPGANYIEPQRQEFRKHIKAAQKFIKKIRAK